MYYILITRSKLYHNIPLKLQEIKSYLFSPLELCTNISYPILLKNRYPRFLNNIDMQFHIIIYTLNKITKSKNSYKPIYTGIFKQFSLWKFM